MIPFAIICCAVSALSTAALVPSTVDPKLWRAVRGRLVRAVELIAAVAGAVPIVAAAALSWAVEELAAYSRQVGQLGAGVQPWHA